MSDSEEPTNQTEPGPLPGPSNVKIAPCSWPIKDLISTECGEAFMPTDISDDVEHIFTDLARSLYYNVCGLRNNRTKTNDDFTKLYKQKHTFVRSEEHVSLSSRLKISNRPQKTIKKLYFWLINQNI